MARAPREVLATPPGFKRCKHCSKSSNQFIDVREKHNECETCREARKKARNHKITSSVPIDDIFNHDNVPVDSEEGETSRLTRAGRTSIREGKRTTQHSTTSDTVALFDSKEQAFETLLQLSEHQDNFRFHGRYVTAEPPSMTSNDEEANRTAAINYIHLLNADVMDKIKWRFTSRGRENKTNARKAIAVHYNCCQDQGKQRLPKGPKDPSKPTKKKKIMDRYDCNGRMTIAYEPEHQVVEIRLTHEMQHPPYAGRRKNRVVDRSAPMAIAGDAGMITRDGGMMQVVDPPMLSAQEASMVYAGASAPPPQMPPIIMDPRAYDVPVPMLDDDLYRYGSIDVPVPVEGSYV